MIAPLALLAARRTAPASTLGILAASAAALAWATCGARGSSVDARTAELLARDESWLVLGGLIAVLTAYRAATLGLDWRRRDADAFGGAQRSRASIAFSSWLGAWAATLALISALAGFVELRVRDAGTGDRELGRVAIASNAAPDDRVRLRATVDPPAGARWLELGLGFIATDVSASVELTARRGEHERTTKQLVASPTRMRVEAPPGDGPLELLLRRTGGHAIVYVTGDELIGLGDPISLRVSSLALFAHWALALAAWTALAFGLGAHLPPLLAALLALTLGVPSLGGEHPLWRCCTPWGALPQAFESLGRCAAPTPPGALAIASTALIVAASLALAARGLRTWRTPR